MDNKRFVWQTRPVALPDNTVKIEKARFTVLTDRLIRIEYSEDESFADRASQSVFYRDFPAAEYSVTENEGSVIIETVSLKLSYRAGAEFSGESLSVRLKNEPASCWNYGDKIETLGGTAQTLDSVNDFIPLEDGICSRNGYAVLDDTESMLLNDDGWVELRPENSTDIYFFGYGFDYRDAIRDFYRLTGAPPLLPAYALGNWWSRYYAYTQQEYTELMERFEKEDIPFSVAVIDMDWHITDVPDDLKPAESDFEKQNNLRPGWTGYTWNKELFPDYKAFLNFLHKQNKKVSINLHPAGGVCPHECQYNAMAKAMGSDPASKKRIPFDILSPKFMANYFDILHHPYEEDGVDFWWMDWQQGTDYRWIHTANENGKTVDPREKLDPLWMLNHLHIKDISRSGKRPMFFSRYSGAGSHRYPIGFSGDTCITWDALKFQPYFTATASNIGYCWWSHDIGGHCGSGDQELIARWFQLGVFSPINRIHTGQSDFMHKEPWYFDKKYRSTVIGSLRLRHRLFPYLYTMNYRCHNDFQPIVQPMYYDYPKQSGAYSSPEQFMFGSELMVMPVSSPADTENQLSQTEVWLPQGDWFDFFTGAHYFSDGNSQKRKLFRTIEQYPVFAKSGAIVPLMIPVNNEYRCSSSDKMQVLVFPGACNSFELYEDAGEGFEYQSGEYCKTLMALEWSETKAVFTIHPAEGMTKLIPEMREWRITLRGFNRKAGIKAFIDGKEITAEIKTDRESNSVCVILKAYASSEIQIVITAENLIHDNYDVLDRCVEILMRTNMYATDKQKIFDIIKMENVSIHEKICRLFYECPSAYNTILALREQLTLTESEY